MERSEFTVAEFIEMLKAMPQDAYLFISYSGYYEGGGGPDKPTLRKDGLVEIGSVSANY